MADQITVKKFMLKKFPTNEYMDCPVPRHHWEVIQEYAEAYHAQFTHAGKEVEWKEDTEFSVLKKENCFHINIPKGATGASFNQAQCGCGLRWVKCKDKTPVSAGWHITRNIPGDLNSVSVLFFHNGEWMDDSSNGANNVSSGLFPTAEWLDESFSCPCERYKEALERISNPIRYLQQEADITGAKLDGVMAIKLSEDANWLQKLASAALTQQ